jgi:hypothetical protein
MRRIARARTLEGYELPVIDITNPAFAVADDANAIGALRSQYLDAERGRARMPGPLMGGLLWLAAGRSLAVRALIEPEASFLSGVSTYVLKLGAPNLSPPSSIAWAGVGAS